jgi:hypothetical protein
MGLSASLNASNEISPFDELSEDVLRVKGGSHWYVSWEEFW